MSNNAQQKVQFEEQSLPTTTAAEDSNKTSVYVAVVDSRFQR
jgi:hypothetical protein